MFVLIVRSVKYARQQRTEFQPFQRRHQASLFGRCVGVQELVQRVVGELDLRLRRKQLVERFARYRRKNDVQRSDFDVVEQVVAALQYAQDGDALQRVQIFFLGIAGIYTGFVEDLHDVETVFLLQAVESELVGVFRRSDDELGKFFECVVVKFGLRLKALAGHRHRSDVLVSPVHRTDVSDHET